MARIKSLRLKLIVFFGILIFPISVFAADFPKPVGFVNDFAGILPADTRISLEQTLSDFEVSTSNEIVVVIVDSFQGFDRFTYSQELFTEWGIGKNNKDNGVLLLIGPSEGQPFPKHGEAFINVGRGLEGVLPDGIAGSILRNEIFPEFKAENFALGVFNGVNAIMAVTQGEYTTSPSRDEKNKGFDPFAMFWLGFVFLSWIGAFLARTKSWWLGGVIGGIVSLVLAFIFLSGLFIVLTTFCGALVGLVFDFVISRNYAIRKAQGKPTDFLHSGGGFWFGGGRGGGGGGFGGFGGGFSGGGGAGGSW